MNGMTGSLPAFGCVTRLARTAATPRPLGGVAGGVFTVRLPETNWRKAVATASFTEASESVESL
jgi:hypothetical protein